MITSCGSSTVIIDSLWAFREPPSGTFGRAAAWWVQGTESTPRGVWGGKGSEGEKESGPEYSEPPWVWFCFNGKSLKYFEHMSETIYAERLFWPRGEPAPLEQERMWLEGIMYDDDESGMVMPAVVSNGHTGLYV